MEFLVEFEVDIPKGTPLSEVNDREAAEAFAAAKLAGEGHLLRLWKRLVASGETKTLGLYRAESKVELDCLLSGLPLSEWMRYSMRFAWLTHGKVPPTGLKPHDNLLAEFPFLGVPNS
jgi:muconolactone delta-isomerase